MNKKISDLLRKGEFSVNGSLWLEGDGVRFFGPGPVQLLELIQETGSINQAARKMQDRYIFEDITTKWTVSTMFLHLGRWSSRPA